MFSLGKRYCYRTSTPALYKQHTKMGGRKRISVFEIKNGAYAFQQPKLSSCGTDLKRYGTSIPVVTETKFLGVVFDGKLTFVVVYESVGSSES